MDSACPALNCCRCPAAPAWQLRDRSEGRYACSAHAIVMLAERPAYRLVPIEAALRVADRQAPG